MPHHSSRITNLLLRSSEAKAFRFFIIYKFLVIPKYHPGLHHKARFLEIIYILKFLPP
jgi:hypothetical protein